MLAPLPFPSHLFSAAAFDLKRFTAQNALYGGQTQVTELAEARWVARFTTAQLRPGEMRAWRAFWDGLRGGLRGFVAHDPAQAYPLAYPTGFAGLVRADQGTAFTGLAYVEALDLPAGIAIGGLPAGFQLAVGDLVELRQGQVRGLYRLVSSATAFNNGVVTIAVEPRILPGLFVVGTLVNFERPSCVMLPEPGSWSYMAQAREAPPATFSGVQKVI